MTYISCFSKSNINDRHVTRTNVSTNCVFCRNTRLVCKNPEPESRCLQKSVHFHAQICYCTYTYVAFYNTLVWIYISSHNMIWIYTGAPRASEPRCTRGATYTATHCNTHYNMLLNTLQHVSHDVLELKTIQNPFQWYTSPIYIWDMVPLV